MIKSRIGDIIGTKKWQLTILEIAPSICKDGRTCVLVRCDCGNEKVVVLSSLNAGTTKSCGCLHSAGLIKRNTSHGKSRHPLYGVWESIKRRCYREKDKSYKNYGGRGVVMCDEWLNSPQSFIEWSLANGWRKGLQIDKDIKAKKMGVEPLIYSPETCCFVTNKQNCNSRRSNHLVEYEGGEYSITQLAELHGTTYDKIRRRIKAGWDVKRALFEPIGPSSKRYTKQPEIKYAFGFIG